METVPFLVSASVLPCKRRRLQREKVSGEGLYSESALRRQLGPTHSMPPPLHPQPHYHSPALMAAPCPCPTCTGMSSGHICHLLHHYPRGSLCHHPSTPPEASANSQKGDKRLHSVSMAIFQLSVLPYVPKWHHTVFTHLITIPPATAIAVIFMWLVHLKKIFFWDIQVQRKSAVWCCGQLTVLKT